MHISLLQNKEVGSVKIDARAKVHTMIFIYKVNYKGEVGTVAKSHFGQRRLAPDIMDRATLRLSTIGPITFWTFHIMTQDFLACDFLAPDIWDQMTHRLITIWPRTIWTCDVMDRDFLDQCILAQDKLDQRTFGP